MLHTQTRDVEVQMLLQLELLCKNQHQLCKSTAFLKQFIVETMDQN